MGSILSTGNDVRQMETIAIIPARGGSKTIPRKNILPLGGYPLLAYSIAAGLQATGVARVIVSTDDDEIAAVSKQYGAEVPFTRPVELARDKTPDLPVFQHALEWLEKQEGYTPDLIIQLRPTSPFRKRQHIEDAVELLASRPDADSVRTVILPFQNPYKMWRINDNGFLSPLLDTEFTEPYNMPRQLLPDVYWQTGYVDVARRSTLVDKNSMTGRHILPLIIEPGDWIDIDSPDDWQQAERLLETRELTFDKLGFRVHPAEPDVL
jgi:CMP-N-acetylneuraminic acid synthetase